MAEKDLDAELEGMIQQLIGAVRLAVADRRSTEFVIELQSDGGWISQEPLPVIKFTLYVPPASEHAHG